jgi:hypothetical protein
MSKRSIAVLVGIVAVALILVVTVPPLLSSPSQIAAKAAGTWQETGEKPAYTMQVVNASSTYLVTYPRWHYESEIFTLHGDKLLGGGGENTMNDRVKSITYDNGSDELTISDQSDHSYAFVRVTRPAGVSGIMREAGGPFPGLRRQPNTLIEVRWAAQEGPVVASATSDQHGRFKVTVAPGEYYVVPVAKGDEQVVPDPVNVLPGAYAVARPFFSVR